MGHLVFLLSCLALLSCFLFGVRNGWSLVIVLFGGWDCFSLFGLIVYDFFNEILTFVIILDCIGFYSIPFHSNTTMFLFKTYTSMLFICFGRKPLAQIHQRSSIDFRFVFMKSDPSGLLRLNPPSAPCTFLESSPPPPHAPREGDLSKKTVKSRDLFRFVTSCGIF